MKRIRKKYEELTITDDFMFGKVMRDPKHCKKLLEIILNLKIQKIEFIDDQQTVDPDYVARGIRIDVYVEDDTDTVYSVEMQARNTGELQMRSRYYQSAVDINLIKKGTDYERLKKSYVIFICTFDLFGRGRAIYHFENLCRENPTIRLEDGTEKIFLNTKGIRDVNGPLEDVDEELRCLLDYFESLVPQDAFTGELDEAVAAAKLHKEWRREYMTLERMMMDSRREGKAEGRAEGKAEAVLELLSELGELTDMLRERIQRETDLQVLGKWLKEAAGAESISEFESKM
ncbi:MAG: Rpn family recombination-promoting nuclease/putative transposase [Firmicutes bacterium]|nr:Rpn family recombination-promoting nuclease/putative transposase [Bacillota bacterium]